MTTPATLAPEIEALVLVALRKRVDEREKLVRATFATFHTPGTTTKYRSPLDEAALGYVQRTDPEPQWRITDEQALREHLAEFPGAVETIYLLAVPGVGMVPLSPLDELAQVLLEHRPELLEEQRQVNPDAVAAALEQSIATGIAAAPGITRVRPGGQLRVVPAKDAGAAIERMLAAGLIRWDGSPVLETTDGAA